MKKWQKVSEKEIKEMRERRRDGWSYCKIAREMGYKWHDKVIYWTRDVIPFKPLKTLDRTRKYKTVPKKPDDIKFDFTVHFKDPITGKEIIKPTVFNRGKSYKEYLQVLSEKTNKPIRKIIKESGGSPFWGRI